jgi:hypothetical protein
MSKCPWCDTDSLSFWQRQTLGPLFPKKCSNCSNYFRASWPSVLVSMVLLLVPVLGGLAYAYSAPRSDLANFFYTCAGLLVGAVASMAWYQKYLRLVRADGPDERKDMPSTG